MQFAQSHFPVLARRLRMMRERDPEVFGQRFAREALAHLRMVRRVYAEDEELGELYRRHAEQFFFLQRWRGSIARAQREDDDARREHATREARRIFAEMIEVERGVIDRLLLRITQGADGRIDARVAALLESSDAPIEEPPPIRDAVLGYRAAEDEMQRAELRETLRRRVAREMEFERDRLQRMHDQLTDHGVEEVDRRLERFVRAADGPRRPPPPPPPREDEP